MAIESFMEFLAVSFLFVGIVVGFVTIPCWLDRFIVNIIRLFNIPVCQTAVMIAISIVQQPDQWRASSHSLTHKEVGHIWSANGAYGLHLDTLSGKWKPNWIERRIIYEAVDWRLKNYIRVQTQKALQQSRILPGKITDV